MKTKAANSINSIEYNDYNNKHFELIKKIELELRSKGYIIIKNFEEFSSLEYKKNKFLEVSQLLGTPIGHDINNKIIWDIKSSSTSKNFIKTYSEHSHEAELHTDSQYSEYPEDFFGLLTLKKANCGGGVSYVLTLKDVLNDLRALKNGVEFEDVLTNTNFPFVVPNVFKKHKSNKHEFNFGPILRANEIRFRIDTFEKAINFDNKICTQEQKNAFFELKKIILNNTKTLKFYLEEGDLIFINNKTTLHGRSLFTDKNRHLLRIRINKNQSCCTNK